MWQTFTIDSWNNSCWKVLGGSPAKPPAPGSGWGQSRLLRPLSDQTFNPGGWPKIPLGPWVYQGIILTGEPLGSSGSQVPAETNTTSPTSLVAAASQILSVVNITHETEPAEFGEPLMRKTLSSDILQSLHNHKSHSSPLQTCLFFFAHSPCHGVDFFPP